MEDVLVHELQRLLHFLKGGVVWIFGQILVLRRIIPHIEKATLTAIDSPGLQLFAFVGELGQICSRI